MIKIVLLEKKLTFEDLDTGDAFLCPKPELEPNVIWVKTKDVTMNAVALNWCGEVCSFAADEEVKRVVLEARAIIRT